MQRNSIHDIKPSSKLRRSRGYESRRAEREDFEEDVPMVPRRRRSSYEDAYDYKKSGGGKAIWYVAVFCVLFLIFSLSFFFSSADVTITPRVGSIDINKIVTANKSPLDSKALSFEMVTLSGEDSITVSAVERKYVETKAKGTVRIFNNHSSAPQNLLIDTRLETPDGKIYKTEKAVSVPGQRMIGGQLTPGYVDVVVYADEAGDEYNKEAADFKILGFKGSPRYENFYARTLTEISGGFKGETFDISEEEREEKEKLLSDNLKADMLRRVRAELPPGFLLFDDSVVFQHGSIEVSGENLMTQEATIYAFIFKEENMTRELTRELVSDFDQNPVYIKNMDSIKVSLLSQNEINPSSVDSLSLSVSGKAEIVWKLSEADIRDSLIGIKERSFETALRDFRNIEKAELSIKPFWKNTLPTDKDKIKVINTISEK